MSFYFLITDMQQTHAWRTQVLNLKCTQFTTRTCKMKAQIGQPRAEQAPYQSPLWAESHEIQKLLCTSLQRNWRKWETKGWELQRRNKTQRESEEREANVERRDYVRVEITDQEGSWNIWNCNDCEGIVFRSRQVELWTLEALRQSCVSVFIIRFNYTTF